MQPPLNRSRTKLKPADKFVLKQNTMLGRLDGLRGMTWAYAVLHHTGLSASTASKKFTPKEHVSFDKKGNPVISNIMYHYLSGKRPPTIGPRGKLGFDLVGAIDKDPLGSQATPWLTHTIWDILNPDISIRQIREYLTTLPEEFTTKAFSSSTKDIMFARDTDSRVALNLLSEMKTFESYVGVLAILRESTLVGDRLMNEYAYITHLMMIDVLIKHPIFQYVYKPFWHFVETFIGNHTKPSAQEILEKEPVVLEMPKNRIEVDRYGQVYFTDELENEP